MATKKIRKAVFPVAGMGTRFLPATKAVPKELLPVVDRPLIQYAVDEALEAGIETMIFVNGRGKGAIEDHFDMAFELEATQAARGKSVAALEGTRLKPGNAVFVRQQEPLGFRRRCGIDSRVHGFETRGHRPRARHCRSQPTRKLFDEHQPIRLT